MGHLHEGALADAASVDKVIDAAVASVAARRGISVALPSAGGGGGATVDAAALSEFTDQITGRDGVLASAARLVLGQLGLDDPVSASPAATDAELIDLVTAELGADWPRLVAPVFDAKKAVVFDDRWASAREDLGQAVADRRGRHRRRLAASVGAVRGRRPRRRDPGHLVAGQVAGRRAARFTRRCTAGSPRAPRTRTPVPTATKSPS